MKSIGILFFFPFFSQIIILILSIWCITLYLWVWLPSTWKCLREMSKQRRDRSPLVGYFRLGRRGGQKLQIRHILGQHSHLTISQFQIQLLWLIVSSSYSATPSEKSKWIYRLLKWTAISEHFLLADLQFRRKLSDQAAGFCAHFCLFLQSLTKHRSNGETHPGYPTRQAYRLPPASQKHLRTLETDTNNGFLRRLW